MDFESIYKSIQEILDKEIPSNKEFIDVCAEHQIPNTKYSIRIWGEENDTDDKFFSIAIYDHSKDDPTMQVYETFSEFATISDLRESLKRALDHLEHHIVNSNRSPSQEERTVTLPRFPIYGNLDHRNLLDLIHAYDLYISTAADADLFAQGWTPVCVEEFYENEYQSVWVRGGNFNYLYGNDSDFITPKDRVENARAFYINGALMCQIDGEEQVRPLRSRIQDIKEGDAFIIECEHPSVYIAKYDAHQNFDESDEPWIVYDENDDGWFEEDIADAELIFRSLDGHTSLEQMLDQATDNIKTQNRPIQKTTTHDKSI